MANWSSSFIVTWVCARFLPGRVELRLKVAALFCLLPGSITFQPTQGTHCPALQNKSRARQERAERLKNPSRGRSWLSASLQPPERKKREGKCPHLGTLREEDAARPVTRPHCSCFPRRLLATHAELRLFLQHLAHFVHAVL